MLHFRTTQFKSRDGEELFEQIGGKRHTLYPLITQCLQDKLERRPTTTELNANLKELCTKHPWSVAGISLTADKVLYFSVSVWSFSRFFTLQFAFSVIYERGSKNKLKNESIPL